MTAAIQVQQVQLANQFVIFSFKEIIVTATDFSIAMTVFILQYYREKSTKVQPKYGRGSSCTCRPVAMQTAMIATLQGWEPSWLWLGNCSMILVSMCTVYLPKQYRSRPKLNQVLLIIVDPTQSEADCTGRFAQHEWCKNLPYVLHAVSFCLCIYIFITINQVHIIYLYF